MGQWGGRRPRHMPTNVPVSSTGSRGRRRRVRINQCVAILAAEVVYDKLLRDGVELQPRSREAIEWKPEDTDAARWTIEADLLPNGVWRRGRLFLRCLRCGSRATRLY